jgi:hypothetical protein
MVSVWVAVAIGAAALLVDHGGTVLTSPQVTAIYLGDYWVTSQGASDAFHTDSFLQAWLAGPSVSVVLAQYRVASASFASSDKVAGASPAQFTDADAQALVKKELAAGRVAGGGQTVHVIYLPPGTVLTFQGVSSLGRLGGYHSSFRDAATGKLVYYAVIVYSQGGNGIDFKGNPQVNLSIFTSRVLAGAFTDPDVGQGTLGWIDDVKGEVGEIAFALSADATLKDVFTFQRGFAVVLLWSNKDAKLEDGSTTPTPTPPATSALSISPATQNVAVGASVTFTVTNSSTAVQTLTLSVSGLPATLTGSFATTSLAPGASTTLTITAAADAVNGTTIFVVTGTGTTKTETATATITIGATTPTVVADFSVTVTPTSQEVTRGGDAITFVIATTQVGAKTTLLKLRTLHVLAGLKAYLSSPRIAAGETATLTIVPHRDARRKRYEIVLKASSDLADQRIPLTIVVK